MILFYKWDKMEIQACPHTRGDDPHLQRRLLALCGLVPIRVGMILFHKFRFVLQSTCPHTRGDDPV